jgi:hypothetical protein
LEAGSPTAGLLHVGVCVRQLGLVRELGIELGMELGVELRLMSLGLILVHVQGRGPGDAVIHGVNAGRLRRCRHHHGLNVLQLLLVHVLVALLHHLRVAVDVEALELLGSCLESLELLLETLLLVRQVGIGVQELSVKGGIDLLPGLVQLQLRGRQNLLGRILLVKRRDLG